MLKSEWKNKVTRCVGRSVCSVKCVMQEYIFAVFVSPVGSYFDGGLVGVDFVTTQYVGLDPQVKNTQ